MTELGSPSPASRRDRCPGCGVEEAEYHRPRCPRLLEAAGGRLTCESCGGGTSHLYGVSRRVSGVDNVCGNCFAWRWAGKWDAPPRPLAEVEAAAWKPPLGSA